MKRDVRNGAWLLLVSCGDIEVVRPESQNPDAEHFLMHHKGLGELVLVHEQSCDAATPKTIAQKILSFFLLGGGGGGRRVYKNFTEQE